MTDTVIKGTGNSRTLRTVPNALTLYPTAQDMLEAMINGTFPVDIGPINPTGVDVKGTALSKANLLTDATAALYGKGSTATPNDIFAAIRPLITTAQNTANSAQSTANTANSGAKASLRVERGSYTGNNKSTLTLNFSVAWEVLIILHQTSGNTGIFGLAIRNSPRVASYYGSNYEYGSCTSTDRSITISFPTYHYLNTYNDTNTDPYYYVVIGKV